MTDYLARPAREAVKNILRPTLAKWTTTHRSGPASDVAVVSSPRSGSTWLMETIATQPGIKYVNEPDHKELLERYHSLNIAPRWLWLSLASHERQELARYLLDDRRSGLFGPTNPFAPNHSWRTDRRVLKLIRMTPLVEWLDSLGFSTVYLLRHPIPQAQSCMKRHHRIVLDDILADAQFLMHLNSDIVSYVRRVAAHGDLMLQYVTQWCLENIVAFKSPLAGKGFTFATHELLVTDSAREMARLAQILGLEHLDLLLARVSEPSRTTDSSAAATVETIRAGKSSRLLNMWRRDLSRDDEHRWLEPLRVFGIDLYTYGETLPDIPSHWIATSEMLGRPEFSVGGSKLDVTADLGH